MLIDLLYEAAESGEIIEVIYYGGSNPGAIRKLSPIHIFDDRIRARDMDDGGIVKTYLTKRMALPGQSQQGKTESQILPTSVKQATESLVSTWESQGWHVSVDEKEAALTRYFKNGKLRKTSDIGISYYPDNRRPYYVYGPGLNQSRTYSKIDRAISTFIDQANQYTPDNYDSWPRTLNAAKEKHDGRL